MQRHNGRSLLLALLGLLALAGSAIPGFQPPTVRAADSYRVDITITRDEAEGFEFFIVQGDTKNLDVRLMLGNRQIVRDGQMTPGERYPVGDSNHWHEYDEDDSREWQLIAGGPEGEQVVERGKLTGGEPATCDPKDASWEGLAHNKVKVTYSGEARCFAGLGIYNMFHFGSLNEPGAVQVLFGPAVTAVVSPTNRIATLQTSGYDDPTCFAQVDVTLAPIGTDINALYPSPLTAANQGFQYEHLIQPAIPRGDRVCGKPPTIGGGGKVFVPIARYTRLPTCPEGAIVVKNAHGEWRLALVSDTALALPPLPTASETVFTVSNYVGTTPHFALYEPFLEGKDDVAYTFAGGYPGQPFKLHISTGCGTALIVSSVDP